MEKNKPQIIHIHGGDSFDNDEDFFAYLKTFPYNPYAVESQKWKNWIKESVAETHDFIAPQFPNAFNARYQAWVIWFEKMLPHLRDDLTLVGYSLGGGFLLRYLSENALPVSLKQLHLVAPVVDNQDCGGVGDFVIDVSTWQGFVTEAQSVHVWHSSDDPYVPIHHSERFVAAYPRATLHRFTDRNHFFQPEFPELLSVVRS
jgi:predicted alpha/beta hydrolase family esterase